MRRPSLNTRTEPLPKEAGVRIHDKMVAARSIKGGEPRAFSFFRSLGRVIVVDSFVECPRPPRRRLATCQSACADGNHGAIRFRRTTIPCASSRRNDL